MENENYTFHKFITHTFPSFLLGVIMTLFVLSLLASCGERPTPTYIKKVVVVKVKKYREPNTLQEYEVKWKVTLSDSNTITTKVCPEVGDTITYRYYSK